MSLPLRMENPQANFAPSPRGKECRLGPMRLVASVIQALQLGVAKTALGAPRLKIPRLGFARARLVASAMLASMGRQSRGASLWQIGSRTSKPTSVGVDRKDAYKTSKPPLRGCATADAARSKAPGIAVATFSIMMGFSAVCATRVATPVVQRHRFAHWFCEIATMPIRAEQIMSAAKRTTLASVFQPTFSFSCAPMAIRFADESRLSERQSSRGRLAKQAPCGHYTRRARL